MMSMHIGGGALTLTLNADGSMELNSSLLPGKFRPEIRWNGTDFTLTDFQIVESSARHFMLAGKLDGRDWSFSALERDGDLVLRLRFDCGGMPFELALTPFRQNAVDAEHFFGQGLRMGNCVSLHFPNAEPQSLQAHHFAVLKRDAEYIMISAPLRNRLDVRFTGEAGRDGITGFRCTAAAAYTEVGTADSGEFTIARCANPFRRMAAWGEAAREDGTDLPAPLEPGWNSWDYYRWTVSEEAVLENAAFIARDPVLSRHVRRIVVDDGWQYCYGEWDANPRFPHGMAYLARELKKMGFEPGLWIAPTIAEPHSRIAQLDPDEMMGLSVGGQPCLAYECMRRYGFVLDPTVEKSRRFIRDLFDRYASMGYSFFKLDFLYATLRAPRFHDPAVPKTDIVRLAVEQAAAGVAGRARLLGCNYPFSSGNRYVDAVRVGSDIAAVWPRIRENSVSVAGNQWAAGRLWINDPDFALCRSLDTSDDPEMLRIRPSAVYITSDTPFNRMLKEYRIVSTRRPQNEVLLSLILVSAGAIHLSDRMTRLNAAGLDLARRTVSAECGRPGVPLDMFDGPYTETWLQELARGARLLLVNWTDEEKTREFDLKAYGIPYRNAVNFWTDETIPLHDGVLSALLPPRSCLFAEIR